MMTGWHPTRSLYTFQMERVTLASGGDLTWTLPHWLKCIPLGGGSDVCACACACAYARPCTSSLPYQWMDFMNKKLLRWDHRLEMEKHPPASTPPASFSHTRRRGLAPILMNPIRVHYGWHTVANLASSDRKGSHMWLFCGFTHRYGCMLCICYFIDVFTQYNIRWQWSLPL